MIKLLPKHIYDKIAAGEVVAGPLSVVKELFENAIDAGACAVSVEIEEGGTRLIRVADDGCGIDFAEVELAFTPHATSKLNTVDDLDRIATLGFRGEALASIAAVSRLEMLTKTASADTGTQVRIAGGEAREIVPCGAADGTLITVSDLFYNVPARRKFLRSARTESAAVVDFVSRMAVAYPKIRVKLVNHGDILFATNGSGDRKRAILTVYGTDAGDLIETEAVSADESMRLTAYLSGVGQGRKSRRGQTLFVNGRYVQDETLQNAVTDAYREFVMEGRHPVVYLFLEIDPALVDVNVHPAKSELRFSDRVSVAKFVAEALRAAISSKAALPKITDTKRLKQLKREENAYYALKEQNSGGPLAKSKDSDIEIYPGEETESASVVTIKSLLSTNSKVAVNAMLSADIPSRHTRGDNTAFLQEEAPDYYSASPVSSTKIQGRNEDDSVLSFESGKAQVIQSQIPIDSLKLLGSVFSEYLIATDADSLYLIDQHAAHERIHYERFLRQFHHGERMVQQLMSPRVVSLAQVGAGDVENWAEFLTRLGFESEQFGKKEIIVKTVPAFLAYAEAEQFLDDILDDASAAPPMSGRALERLISRACRRAIKAGDSLAPDELRALLRELAACENPLTCPHGRPVFVRLGKYDLDRMFKRV